MNAAISVVNDELGNDVCLRTSKQELTSRDKCESIDMSESRCTLRSRTGVTEIVVRRLKQLQEQRRIAKKD